MCKVMNHSEDINLKVVEARCKNFDNEKETQTGRVGIQEITEERGFAPFSKCKIIL